MGYRILIVDDSAIIRSVLKKVLKVAGIEVSELLEAGNGKEAIEKLQASWVDLVFLDINMPVMNGVEFLKHVRADSVLKTIPVIVVSTEGSQIRLQELADLGVSAQLRKPVAPETLAETVKKVIGEYRHA